MNKHCFYLLTGLIGTILSLTTINLSHAQAPAVNSTVVYVIDGEPTTNWRWIMGNESNWYQPVQGQSETQGGKLKVNSEMSEGKPSLHAVWRKSNSEQALYLSGAPINISDAKDKAALFIEIKLNAKPKQPVSLRMDCGYPCSGATKLNDLVSNFPIGEWAWLPIPLNCFAKAGTDLTNVDTVMQLQSAGNLDLHIANMRLMTLPEGYVGCGD